MDPKSAKTFGCFLGVLIALLVLQIINALFDLSLTMEYAVFFIAALIFGVIGMIFVSFIAKKSMTSNAKSSQVSTKARSDKNHVPQERRKKPVNKKN